MSSSRTKTISELLSLYGNIISKTDSFSHNTYEFEVRFREENINKQTFDDIFKALIKYGFVIEHTEYQLKIAPDEKSKIRVELDDIIQIQELCKSNHFPEEAKYTKKTSQMEDGRPAYNDDFGFRTSIQQERSLNMNDESVKAIKENWNHSLKLYRYLYRTSLIHPDMPHIRVDMSVVRTNKQNQSQEKIQGKTRYIKRPIYCKTFLESNVLNEFPFYEVEIECIDATREQMKKEEVMEHIETTFKKTIKYIVGAIQKTPFPVSHSQLKDVFKKYLVVLHSLNKKQRIHKPYFLGPSSITLQKENLLNNSGKPYIKENYCVTDKADGERKLLFILNNKLYFIDTNHNVQFTGVSATMGKRFTIIDGEYITVNKKGQSIHQFAAFDIYVMNDTDCRKYPFIEDRAGKPEINSRYAKLINYIDELNQNITSGNMKLFVKNFYYEKKDSKTNEKITSMEEVCDYILKHIDGNTYEYNTDGLIFSSKYDPIPQEPRKITWDKSFKWKPAEYNTIDFLISVQKNNKGEKILKTKNINGTLVEYYEIELQVGFNDVTHGHVNAQNKILNLDYDSSKKKTSSRDYYPKAFHPTNPSISNACVCHLMVSKDKNGSLVMFTTERDVIEDDTIVEFSYDLTKEDNYEKWVPLRVRHDKTNDYKKGKPNYGNAYHVANNNWQSIHNPIIPEMLTGKVSVLLSEEDDGVYYNRTQYKSETTALRHFHNLYVKKRLIEAVSTPKMNLIDLAVGKAGDLNKWVQCNLGGVLGIDISKDNIHNPIDGACARYLNLMKKQTKSLPVSMFIHGDSRKSLIDGDFEEINNNNGGESNHILKTLMGSTSVSSSKLSPFLKKYHGIFGDKFDICSIQFALHYMFESKETLHQFITNVSNYTKVGGYFIGTCYDGVTIYKKLKENPKLELWKNSQKIWHIKSKYDDDTDEFLNGTEQCIGYKISVYQESINKEFDEYLVHFDYFVKIMNDYGFVVDTEHMGGIDSFESLYNEMQQKSKDTYPMSTQEKEISFLNKYFVFRKHQNITRSLYDVSNPLNFQIGKAVKLDKTIILESI
uniref:mRNA (guanine-N(7))-methyltransferase n=1 Tax=viral metagenome TaxID=1070528 RepID=A0A6C0KJ45_9ZZZZ